MVTSYLRQDRNATSGEGGVALCDGFPLSRPRENSALDEHRATIGHP
jgi:hypothetical protein